MKRNMYYIKAIFFLVISAVLVFSCNKNRTTDNTNTDVSNTEVEKRKIIIYGYGYSSGANEIGAEMFARQRAKLAIAEQLRGSSFTIRKKDNEIVFTSETGLLELPGIKTESERKWQRNGGWEHLIIVSSELEIAVPADKAMIEKTIDITDDDGTFTFAESKQKAVLEAWQEKTEQDPDLLKKNQVTGHVYIISLEMTPPSNSSGFVIHIKYGIVFN